MKIYRNFDAFIKLELLEYKVPMVCLVTGCVSGRKDGRYFDFKHLKLCAHIDISYIVV